MIVFRNSVDKFLQHRTHHGRVLHYNYIQCDQLLHIRVCMLKLYYTMFTVPQQRIALSRTRSGGPSCAHKGNNIAIKLLFHRDLGMCRQFISRAHRSVSQPTCERKGSRRRLARKLITGATTQAIINKHTTTGMWTTFLYDGSIWWFWCNFIHHK